MACLEPGVHLLFCSGNGRGFSSDFPFSVPIELVLQFAQTLLAFGDFAQQGLRLGNEQIFVVGHKDCARDSEDLLCGPICAHGRIPAGGE